MTLKWCTSAYTVWWLIVRSLTDCRDWSVISYSSSWVIFYLWSYWEFIIQYKLIHLDLSIFFFKINHFSLVISIYSICPIKKVCVVGFTWTWTDTVSLHMCRNNLISSIHPLSMRSVPLIHQDHEEARASGSANHCTTMPTFWFESQF